MSYSPQVFLSLCTLEPLRNPKWGLSPSVCAAGRQGYSKRWTPPQIPRTAELPCRPLRGTGAGIILGMGWG